MPGKVNPVIPEVVNMVCFRVRGSDLTVSMAAEAGQLQLNVFEPVIAACIFEAQTIFMNAARTLRVHCVEGITTNVDIMRHYVDYSIGTVTALNPVIGYDKSTALAAEATRPAADPRLVREEDPDRRAIAKVLDPAAMTGQGDRHEAGGRRGRSVATSRRRPESSFGELVGDGPTARGRARGWQRGSRRRDFGAGGARERRRLSAGFAERRSVSTTVKVERRPLRLDR
jgi:hypothetical protein